MSPEFAKTEKNRIRRKPQRGHYERETIYQILDEALICHVGFVENGQPFVIPTNFARVDDTLILHGAPASRLLKHIEAGNPVCIEVTITDGLVLARSVFHHSINYRSVVVFGTGRILTDEQEKMNALQAVVEHLVPGRWSETRWPNPKEMDATKVIAVQIDEASAKVRTGPVIDDEEDYSLPVWAGVLPLQETPLPPIDDERLAPGTPVPDYIARYKRRKP